MNSSRSLIGLSGISRYFSFAVKSAATPFNEQEEKLRHLKKQFSFQQQQKD